MTLPAVIRIFFAIDLPASIKEEVGHFISLLKKKSKSHGIRWTKPENLHITLHFMSEVQTEDLDKLITLVKKEIKERMAQSLLTLDTLHLFPTPYRPRVIVLNITPQEPLTALAKQIGEGIVAANYPIESRPFRAHLTLGRIKHAQNIDLHFLSDCPVPPLTSIDVSEVVLFRSEPQPEGSRYTVLERIMLNTKDKLSA